MNSCLKKCIGGWGVLLYQRLYIVLIKIYVTVRALGVFICSTCTICGSKLAILILPTEYTGWCLLVPSICP